MNCAADMGDDTKFDIPPRRRISMFVPIGDPAVYRAPHDGGGSRVQHVVRVATSRTKLRRSARPQGQPEARALLLAETEEASIEQCIEPSLGVYECLGDGTMQDTLQDSSHSKKTRVRSLSKFGLGSPAPGQHA